MTVAIPYMMTALLITVVLFGIGTDMFRTFDEVTSSWMVLQDRSERQVDTRISGPIGLSLSATSTLQITLANDGEVALGNFSGWDVIFEVQKAPGLGISYLSYTTSSSLATGEWTAKGIYLNAASSTAEILDPGIFNPGEEMIILANPSPSVVANTYDRAVSSTPNGVAAKTIFHVVP